MPRKPQEETTNETTQLPPTTTETKVEKPPQKKEPKKQSNAYEFRFGLHHATGAMTTKVVQASGATKEDARKDAEKAIEALKTKLKFDKYNLISVKPVN